MPKLIITTCGLSLNQAICWKGLPSYLQKEVGLSPDNFGPQALAADRDRQGCARAWTLGKIIGGFAGTEFDSTYWEQNRRGFMSAELDTLCLIDVQTPVQRADAIKLVHGPQIRAQAEALQSILVERTPWRGHGKPSVDLMPIEKLDARDAADFREGLDALSEAIDKSVDQHMRKHPRSQVILCLSGGFKGVTAAMLLVAFRLRENSHDVRAYYVHETSKSLIALPTNTSLTFTAAERGQ